MDNTHKIFDFNVKHPRSDFTIKVGEKSFFVDGLSLSLESTFFNGMFNNSMKESITNVLDYTGEYKEYTIEIMLDMHYKNIESPREYVNLGKPFDISELSALVTYIDHKRLVSVVIDYLSKWEDNLNAVFTILYMYDLAMDKFKNRMVNYPDLALTIPSDKTSITHGPMTVFMDEVKLLRRQKIHRDGIIEALAGEGPTKGITAQIMLYQDVWDCYFSFSCPAETNRCHSCDQRTQTIMSEHVKKWLCSKCAQNTDLTCLPRESKMEEDKPKRKKRKVTRVPIPNIIYDKGEDEDELQSAVRCQQI